MNAEEVIVRARALGGALEPFVGQVYFSPECHSRYEALGFKPSPGEMNGVASPEGISYFTSRGSLMGQVPGELVAAAFAVLGIATAKTETSAAEVRATRLFLRFKFFISLLVSRSLEVAYVCKSIELVQ